MRMVCVAQASWEVLGEMLLRMCRICCWCLHRKKVMWPLVETKSPKHTASLENMVAPSREATDVPGMSQEQYPPLVSTHLVLLFIRSHSLIEIGIFSRKCRIQQREQQKSVHFGNLILSAIHLEILGQSLMAWKPPRREIVLRETPLATQ